MSEIDIQKEINKLTQYALDRKIISENEKYYSINLLLDVLNLDEFVPSDEKYSSLVLEEILKNILDWAYENKLIKENTTVYRDLFDTKVMNCFVPRPDTVVNHFNSLYLQSKEEATNWFYQFSKDTDYIRAYRTAKDLKWKVDTEFGQLDITINLSKPEKDPKAIAAAKLAKNTAYPKCQLCQENQGYRGRLNHPARETIRIIPIKLDGDDFYLQYSPYGYYNEHCIVFNKKHIPMEVNEACFTHLVKFVEMFPHYMLGSNADLPIVGGSILTHDHYQGGRYRFPMFDAKDIGKLHFDGFEDIKASFLYWPLSVIRLRGKDRSRIIKLSSKILEKWRKYTDEENFIYAYTDETPHNTITPICHKEGDEFIMDLTLRNNITTDEYPLGYYHPHSQYWNIKKENIGLIEVMGVAILPARLKKEMQIVKEDILSKTDVALDERVKAHARWVEDILANNQNIDENNIDMIINKEIGKTFEKVLCCCGVYTPNEQGLLSLKKFVKYVNE